MFICPTQVGEVNKAADVVMNGPEMGASASGDGKADKTADEKAADTAKKKKETSTSSSWWWPCTSAAAADQIDEAEFIMFSGNDNDEWFIMEFHNVQQPPEWEAGGDAPKDSEKEDAPKDSS